MPGLLMTGLRIKLEPNNVTRFGNIGAHHASLPTSGPKSTVSGKVVGTMAKSN